MAQRSTDLNPNDDNKYSEIFGCICSENLPEIENETPPDGFYEEIDECTDHFHSQDYQDMRLNIIEPHPREFSNETIMHLVQLTEMNDLPQLELEPVSKPESEPEPEPQPELELKGELVQQVEPKMNPETHTQQTQTDTHQLMQGYTNYVARCIRCQGRYSIWSLARKFLLMLSLLHGSYLLCSFASRSGIMQRMLGGVSVETSPPPLPTPPLPFLIWKQLCRLTRKLFNI